MNPGKAKRKTGGESGSGCQYLTQSLQTICDARRNRSGDQPYDRAQSQQQPNLLR